MTLPHFCHILTEIKIQYSSTSKFPNELLYAFRYPRIAHSNCEIFKKYFGEEPIVDVSPDIFYTCEQLLKSQGYSLILADDDPRGDEIRWKIKKAIRDDLDLIPSVGEGKEFFDCINGSKALVRVNDAEYSGPRGQNIDDVERLIRRSMIYYVSLFGDYSKNYESLNNNSGVKSNNTCWINKNSKYEMVSSLRDCIIQVKHSNTGSDEAVCITDEYSAILSNDDVLITKMQPHFRSALLSEGIPYMTIYDEIIHYAKSLSHLVPKQCEIGKYDLITAYLGCKATKKRLKSTRDTYEHNTAGETETNHLNKQERINLSKSYLLKSLNLPQSEDYDINVIRIRGRSNCHKLFGYLERRCVEDLLKLKNDKAIPTVKCILSNFPVLFAKVQEARIKLEESDNEVSRNDLNKICIRGLILPSVLNNLFKIFETLENRSILKGTRIDVQYNSVMGSELYEANLQISEKSRIIHNFFNNMKGLQSNFPYSYKALKKLMPFMHFTICKGRINVCADKTIAFKDSGRSITEMRAIKYDRNDTFTKNISHTFKRLRDVSRKCKVEISEGITLLNDTLYRNLSQIKFTMIHIGGTDAVKNMSTKSFLDESLRCVQNTCLKNLQNIEDHGSVRAYLELYPYLDFIGTKYVMDNVLPYNLVNLVWVLSYLLHVSGRVPFVDMDHLKKSVCDFSDFEEDFFQFSDVNYANCEGISNSSTKRMYPDPCSSNLSGIHENPLAQQSYIIHLAHHINFNKGFFHRFGKSYIDYSRQKLSFAQLNSLDGGSTVPKLAIPDNETESFGKDMDYDKSIPTDFSLEKDFSKDLSSAEALKLTSGWKEFMHRIKHNKQVNKETFGTEEKPDNTDNSGEISSVEPQTLVLVCASDQLESNEFEKFETKKSFTVICDGVTNCYNDISKAQPLNCIQNTPGSNASQKQTEKSVSVGFGTVSSTSRIHGRVHHCIFNFDLSHPFGEADWRVHFNQVMSHLEEHNKRSSIPKKRNNHSIFVFMTLRSANAADSNKVKLIKDIINSELLSFTDCGTYREPEKEPQVELTVINVENFVKAFRRNITASVGNICRREDVSYSFVSNIENLEEHTHYVIHNLGSDITLRVYGITLSDLGLSKLSDACNRIDSLVNNVNSRLERIHMTRHFIRCTWIYDGYFNGKLDINHDDLPGIHQLVYQNGELREAYSVKELINQYYPGFPQTSNRRCLTFKKEYESIKFLWGWSFYVLYDNKDIGMDLEDCILYRRYCGIEFKFGKNLEELEIDIKEDLIAKLKPFGICEEHIEEFSSHNRMYTNSIILSSKEILELFRESICAKVQSCNESHIKPKIGSMLICFGKYDGIPIINIDWLATTLENAKPAKICEYEL